MLDINGQFNLSPIPPAMTQVVASSQGPGPGHSASITAYFLNESSFNSTPTDNGSGVATVTNTYGDGWSGKGYNQIANNRGIKCYGFTLQYVITSSGAQSAAALNGSGITLLVSSLVGANQIPKGFVLSAGARNTQYLPGEMTVRYSFCLNSLSQISYIVPVLNTATLVVLTERF